MNILFITDNFPPEVNAPATRTYEHCIEWIKAGHSVTIVTSAPNFPIGKVYDGYKNKWKNIEWVDGIKVIRVWTYIAENKGFAKRIIDYVSFAATSLLAGLNCKCDIIIATSPQFFTTLSGYGLSLLKRKPWVFELRDLWPDSIKTVGAMQDGFAIRMLEKLELFLYKKADLIVPVTNAFKTKLIARGIPAQKQVVITNGCNLDLYKPMPKDEKLLDELGLQGKFIFSYIGTHGMAHSLEFVIDAIKEFMPNGSHPYSRIHFLLVGAGARKQACIELAQKLGLSNVTFVDPVPKEQVPRYLSITDVCLATLIRKDTFKTVIPSKIFEAAAMNKPILLGVEGQAKEIIDSYQSGLCYIPEDKDDFLKQVVLLTNTPAEIERLKNGCPKLVHDYDRKKLANEMLEALQKIATQSPLS